MWVQRINKKKKNLLLFTSPIKRSLPSLMIIIQSSVQWSLSISISLSDNKYFLYKNAQVLSYNYKSIINIFTLLFWLIFFLYFPFLACWLVLQNTLPVDAQAKLQQMIMLFLYLLFIILWLLLPSKLTSYPCQSNNFHPWPMSSKLLTTLKQKWSHYKP